MTSWVSLKKRDWRDAARNLRLLLMLNLKVLVLQNGNPNGNITFFRELPRGVVQY